MNSGHKQVKLHGFFLNYTRSPDCITDHPKRGRKNWRRTSGISDSITQTDAGSSTPSSHASACRSAPTLQLSTSTGAPGPSTANENAAASTENLIDLHSPPSMPGEISGLMATMNITEHIHYVQSNLDYLNFGAKQICRSKYKCQAQYLCAHAQWSVVRPSFALFVRTTEVPK